MSDSDYSDATRIYDFLGELSQGGGYASDDELKLAPGGVELNRLLFGEQRCDGQPRVPCRPFTIGKGMENFDITTRLLDRGDILESDAPSYTVISRTVRWNIHGKSKMTIRGSFSILFWLAWCLETASSFSLLVPRCDLRYQLVYGSGASRSCILSAKSKSAKDITSDDSEKWVSVEDTDVIQHHDEADEEVEDWVPDMEKAKRKREIIESIVSPSSATRKTAKESATESSTGANRASGPSSTTPSPYTEEEEEVIRAMGGKRKQASSSKREPGFLGDCTLEEIATDYSVPVCYLADVLCMWGTPVPIDVHARLGDLVTGEQAFAILEAINSLDVAALNDRYSNQSLIVLCDAWDIPLNEAFEMAVKEGWSLPFGVHTVLRVEQEDDLIRVLGSIAP